MTEPRSQPLIEQLGNLIPTGQRLVQMETILHEYIGIAYYRARGWI